MTKSEVLIRTIFGPACRDIRPLIYAIDITMELLFVQNVAIDDIRVTKDVYPKAAALLGQKTASTAKSIERLCNRCWFEEHRNCVDRVIGRALPYPEPPRQMLIYFAYYVQYDMPFYEAIQKGAALMI